MKGQVEPWTLAQLKAVVMVIAFGGAAIVFATSMSTDETSLSDQVRWLNVAVVGLVLTAIAAGALVLYGHRAVGSRRRRLVPDLARAGRTTAETLTSSGWLWIEGTVRAHRSGCPLSAGKRAIAVDAADVRDRGLRRCEVCGS